jgi:hypothetical protein
MLLITKGQTKNWILTLTEKVTIANPKFLFSFKHRVTELETNKLLTDISAFKDRYNKFTVVNCIQIPFVGHQINHFNKTQINIIQIETID